MLLAALMYSGVQGYCEFFCGGALIKETAYSYTSASSTSEAFGVFDFQSSNEPAQPRWSYTFTPSQPTISFLLPTTSNCDRRKNWLLVSGNVLHIVIVTVERPVSHGTNIMTPAVYMFDFANGTLLDTKTICQSSADNVGIYEVGGDVFLTCGVSTYSSWSTQNDYGGTDIIAHRMVLLSRGPAVTGVPQTVSAPTTGSPTTGVPTTGAPTKRVPTTGAPTTRTPTTRAPTAKPPTATSVPKTSLHGSFGGDVSERYADSSAWACAKAAGWSFVVVRAYRSVGSVDTNASATLQAAKAGGIAIRDIYHWPCFSKTASSQLQATVDAIGVGNFRKLWIDIENNPSTQCGWSTNKTKNCQLLSALITAGNGLGLSLGVYSQVSEWNAIMGSGDACLAGSSLPLWYVSLKTGEAAYADFVPFGGWKSPFMKQYSFTSQLATSCGIKADADWVA